MMKLCVLSAAILWAFVGLSLAEKVHYDYYKVYKCYTQTQEHIDFLRNLEDTSDAYNFWTQVGQHPGQQVDIMVPPHKVEDFENMMKSQNIPFEVMIENVQDNIDQEQRGSMESRAAYGWKAYYGLNETYDWLNNLVKAYPKNVELLDAGSTYEGRRILGVKISFGKPGVPGVWLDAGIHAREWITVTTATYVINQLLTSQVPEIKNLATSYDWYIFPSVNPDGYEFSYKTNRMWRKTRQPHGKCYGADPNRNWGYKWMEGGASQNPCADDYAGPSPFSEVETSNLSKYFTGLAPKISAYLSLHSYSQVILWSYGHTRQHLDNHDDLEKIAKKAKETLAQRHGTRYTYGNIVEAMYVATGSSMDWVKGTHKIPITFTYELRDKGQHGFILPPEQIEPCGEEVLDSFVTLFKSAKDLGYFRQYE